MRQLPRLQSIDVHDKDGSISTTSDNSPELVGPGCGSLGQARQEPGTAVRQQTLVGGVMHAALHLLSLANTMYSSPCGLLPAISIFASIILVAEERSLFIDHNVAMPSCPAVAMCLESSLITTIATPTLTRLMTLVVWTCSSMKRLHVPPLDDEPHEAGDIRVTEC